MTVFSRAAGSPALRPIVTPFLLIALALVWAAPCAAVPGEVTGLEFSSSSSLIWSPRSNIAAYHVYRGEVSSLRQGSYGVCYRGSVETNHLEEPAVPPVGGAYFYLVSAWDGSGEGSLGESSSRLPRHPAVPCIPARRLVPLTPNGAAIDGVQDGGEARRNAHVFVWDAAQDVPGLNTATGELSVRSTDMAIGGRGLGWSFSRTYRSQIDYDGPLGAGWDFADNLHLQPLGGDVLFHDGSGRTERFASLPGGGWVSPAGLYGTLTQNQDGSRTIRFVDAASEAQKAAHKADVGAVRSGIMQVVRASYFGHSQGSNTGPPARTTITVTNEGRDRLRIVPTAQTTGRGVPTKGFDYTGGGHNNEDGLDARDVVGSKPLPRTEVVKKLWGYVAPSPSSGPATVLLNFSAGGRLESIEDERGNHLSYLYDHQNLLTQVVDSLGRVMTYTYLPDGRLATVSDFAGRVAVLTFDGIAHGERRHLVSVRSPLVSGTPTGNDFTSGKTTTYAYSSGFSTPRLNGNLVSIVTPAQLGSGVETLQASYGTPGSFGADRVLSLSIGGTNGSGVPAGGGSKLVWSALNAGSGSSSPDLPRRRLVMIDPNGNEKTLVHNATGQLLSVTESVSGGLTATRSYQYNTDGELLQVVNPLGNRTVFTYDSAGPDRYRQGNLLQMRDIADPVLMGGRGDGHGGEAADLVWTFTYEPVFNQLASMTGPKGNDPSYVPPNGGPWSPERYTWRWTYDYQEGNPATNGLGALVTRFGIVLGGTPLALGDLNQDGLVDQAAGNPVKQEAPAVRLDPASQQAAIEGDTSQEIVTLWRWNEMKQLLGVTDAAGNTHEVAYYPETDPDGDGISTPTPPDGRLLVGTTGGLFRFTISDTTSDPSRNNGTNPTPVAIRNDFAYDAAGRLTDVVDGRGVRTRMIWNALDQLVEMRPAAATASSAGPFGDPATGRGESGLAPIAARTRWFYDADDRVVKVAEADAEGQRGLGPFVERTFVHDILGNLVSTTEPLTATTTATTLFSYDANENLVGVTWPAGNSDAWTYDGRDLVVSTTRGASGPRGGSPSTRTYGYDLQQNLVSITDGEGHPVDMARDGFDRTARMIDQLGSTVDMYRDPDEDMDHVVLRGPVGGAPPLDRAGANNVDLSKTFYQRDELRRVIKTGRDLFLPTGIVLARPASLTEGPLVPGDGRVNHAMEYDELSRLTFDATDSGVVTRRDYNGGGQLTSAFTVGNDAPEIASFTYDASDNLVEASVTERSSSSGPPAEEILTTHFFDALDRPTMTVDNIGRAHRFVWGSLSDLVVTSDPNGPSGGTINRRSSGHTGIVVPINGHGNVTRYAHDGRAVWSSRSRVLTATGKGDGTTTPSPDLTNPFNPDGQITDAMEWTSNGELSRAIDDRGNETLYAYDNLGRRVSATADDGTTLVTTYDHEDNPVTTTDPNGTITTNTYDAAGRRIQATIIRGNAVEGTTLQVFEHDGLGRMTRASDNNQPAEPADDTTVRLSRDSLGRIVEEAQRVGMGAILTSDQAWLAEDLLTRLTYPSGRFVDYSYDAHDRLHMVADSASPHHVQIDYFGQDRWHTRTFDNGLRTTMLDNSGSVDIGYDGAQRPILMRHLDPGNGVVAGFEYTYDRAGNRLSERLLHRPTGPATFQGTLHAYDSANRLLSVVEGSLDGGLVLVGPSTDDQSFTLDGAGSWPLMSRHGVTFQATPNNLNLYDEPQSGGTHVDDGVPDDFLDVVGGPPDGLSLVHDKNGNQTDTGPTELVYDFLGRPVRTVRSSDFVTVGRYAYDGMGRLSSRTGDGQIGLPPSTTRYLSTYVGAKPGDALEVANMVVEERDSQNAVSRQSVALDGTYVWQDRGGAMDLLLADGLGSVVALLDAASPAFLPSERVSYDAFGKPTFETFDGVPKIDSTGNFLSRSDFGNTNLFLGMRYDHEMGARTSSVTTDLGGFYGGGGGAGSFNPNQGRKTSSTNFSFTLEGFESTMRVLTTDMEWSIHRAEHGKGGVSFVAGGGTVLANKGLAEVRDFSSRRGVVGGCGGGNYCPSASVGRGVVSGCGGGSYCPSAAAGRGVVSGCGGGNYCLGGTTQALEWVETVWMKQCVEKDTTVRLADQSRGGHGGGGGGGCGAGSGFVEELARRGVVGGCGGGNYCPTSASARRGVTGGCGGGNYCPGSSSARQFPVRGVVGGFGGTGRAAAEANSMPCPDGATCPGGNRIWPSAGF